jgi:3-oxoacyl-(acyl-carrier-protein) synthase
MPSGMPAAISPSVWISGIGAICGAGGNTGAILGSFAEGRRNSVLTVPFESTISCPTFQVSGELPVLPGRFNASRTLRLTMAAVKEAMEDAGIERFGESTRVGVCLGTTVASQLNNIPFYEAWRREPKTSLDPIYDYLSANLGRAVGEMLGVRGPRMTIVNACSSGTDAIGVAANWIRMGVCDVAIAGGADELNRVAMAGFWSLGVTSSQPCAPFDRDRAGLNLGEGAGVVILESQAHAKTRGKLCEFAIAGFGAACDAHHLTAPHPEGRGLDAAVRAALAEAKIEPAEIAFVNAHGTATADNDRAEGKVLARIFGDGVKFLSTKGFTGHTLGAAGGLEAVFTALGLRERWVPASAGFVNRGEDIPVAPVGTRKAIAGDFALSTSLAFGGNNSAVVIGRVG